MNYGWLVGAGASASSGIPTAADSARIWLKQLKYFETGEADGVEQWASKRFEGYDPEDPAAVYAGVFHAYLHTEQDRRRELERLIQAAELGFGYATLAQMMSHENWGSHNNIAISMNYDDLCTDALHLFSQERPQMFTPESLYRSTPISPLAPTVIKLFGDAHLPQPEPGSNRPQLPGPVRERVREMIADRGLIMVGYGGRDISLLDMLDGLPNGSPTGGVFWVNSEPPKGAFGEWLRSRNAIWVQHDNFDELMYLVRLEFGLGHPRIERFERFLRRYESQYRELTTRSGMGLSETPEAEDGSIGPRLSSGRTLTSRRITPESQRQRLRESLRAFTKALDERVAHDFDRDDVVRDDFGHDDFGHDDFGHDDFDHDQSAAPTPDGEASERDGERKSEQAGMHRLLTQAREELGRVKAPRHVLRAIEPQDAAVRSDEPDGDPLDLNDIELLDNQRRAARRDDADEVGIQEVIDSIDLDLGVEAAGDEDARRDRERAVERAKSRDEKTRGESRDAGKRKAAPGIGGMREMGDSLRGKARHAEGAPWRGAREEDGAAPLPPDEPRRLSANEALAGRHALAAAVERAPKDAALRARQARFLANSAGDVAAAEECYERAHQLAPDNIAILREYAIFALCHLREAKRAERLLKQAFNLEMRNAETLRAIAGFLLRARGDLDEAETCLRLAVDIEPERPANLIDYARFLDERRGRRDAAETALRRAAEGRPKNSRALAELAVFRIQHSLAIDSIDPLLTEAARLAPDDSLVTMAEAMLSERKGNLDDAEARYRRAIEIEPSNMRAQIAYARFLSVRRGDRAAADAQFAAAIAASPTSAAPLSAHGRFLDEVVGDHAKADRRHFQALELEPYNPDVLAALAEHLSRRPETSSDADDYFRDALALSPRSAPILRAYGRFLEECLGDHDAAEENLRKAVEIDPESAEALDELAQFLHTARADAEEAEIYFREALRVAPDRADTLGRFAAFLRDTRRDLDEAERYYKKALDRNPRDAYTLARNAQFLLAEGRQTEGLKILIDAFDAAWLMDPAVRPQSLMLELWIYRYAHDPGRRDESLGAAMALIDAKVRCDGWDMGPTVEQAIRAGHPDAEMLRNLAEVATDGADPAILKARRKR